MSKPLFEKYANLIRKRAHEYSEKTGIDYSELESQGFLIYCECLEKFDPSKAQFTTYLYIQLNRLNDFAKTYKRQQGVCIQDYYSTNDCEVDENNYEEMLPSRPDSPAVADFLNEAKEVLSNSAYELLVWIVGREWEGKNRRTPTISMAVKYFHYTKQAVERAWEECRTFWQIQGSAFYA